MSFSHRAFLFLLFALAIILIWMALGPLIRELTVNSLNLLGQKGAAAYVNSA